MYLHNNFEVDKNVCIKEKKNIFTGIMTSMIINLTTHDPKTPCYHIFCLIDCILLPSLKLIGYISLNPLAMELFNPKRAGGGAESAP